MNAMGVRTPTVDFDPNNLDPRNTGLHVALLSEADQRIGEQMLVRLRQAADVEGDDDWVGLGVVVEVNYDLGIAYLQVDWSSFRDQTPGPAPGASRAVRAAPRDGLPAASSG